MELYFCFELAMSTTKNRPKKKSTTERYIQDGSVAAALGGEPLREPPPVLAVVVAHVLLSPRDAAPFFVAGHPLHPPVAAGGARRAGRAPSGLVPAVLDDERRVGPVDGDLALARGPPAAVPERGVHLHGPGARVGQVGVALEHAHRHAVYLEDDVVRGPDDGVLVEVGGRVEPQVELVLLLPVPARPHVGVEHHGVARRVAHELHVDLVVVGAVAGPRRDLQNNAMICWLVVDSRSLLVARMEYDGGLRRSR
jgi:hypothetical protein